VKLKGRSTRKGVNAGWGGVGEHRLKERVRTLAKSSGGWGVGGGGGGGGVGWVGGFVGGGGGFFGKHKGLVVWGVGGGGLVFGGGGFGWGSLIS